MDQKMMEEDVCIEVEEGEIQSMSDEEEVKSMSEKEEIKSMLEEDEMKSVSEEGELKSVSDEGEIKSISNNEIEEELQDTPSVSRIVQDVNDIIKEQEDKLSVLERNNDILEDQVPQQDTCLSSELQSGSTTVYNYEGYTYYYDHQSQTYVAYHECSDGEDQKLGEKKDEQKVEETKEVVITNCPLKYDVKKLIDCDGESECLNENCQHDSTENHEPSVMCDNVSGSQNEEQDLAKQYPPCVRIVVEKTEMPSLKIGTLFIVTCVDNATIGRLPSREIYIPDTHVSRAHARLWYDSADQNYKILDLGSRKGVSLNNERLEVSKSYPVLHNSLITLHKTQLRCHIHIGNDTCDGCEPGVVQQNSQNTEKQITSSPRHGTNKKDMHRKEEKRLRQKYGLMGDYVVTASKVAEGYEDKARNRRTRVGSSNPHEKTQQASIDTPIANDNKGYEMLSKMGWVAGQSLGRSTGNTTQSSGVIGGSKWKPLQKL